MAIQIQNQNQVSPNWEVNFIAMDTPTLFANRLVVRCLDGSAEVSTFVANLIRGNGIYPLHIYCPGGIEAKLETVDCYGGDCAYRVSMWKNASLVKECVINVNNPTCTSE